MEATDHITQPTAMGTTLAVDITQAMVTTRVPATPVVAIPAAATTRTTIMETDTMDTETGTIRTQDTVDTLVDTEVRR